MRAHTNRQAVFAPMTMSALVITFELPAPIVIPSVFLELPPTAPTTDADAATTAMVSSPIVSSRVALPIPVPMLPVSVPLPIPVSRCMPSSCLGLRSGSSLSLRSRKKRNKTGFREQFAVLLMGDEIQ